MRKYYPNILIFCGSGQNVGKTSLIKSVIESVTKKQDIAALKICPHFHTSSNDESIIWQEKDFKIMLEKGNSLKDSSLFFQAGANPVFYVETKDDSLEKAFHKVIDFLGDHKLIICESGHLGRLIKPGLLVYVENSSSKEFKKNTNQDIADLVLQIGENELEDFLLEINRKIDVIDHKWILV